jgi:hypothetical protein
VHEVVLVLDDESQNLVQTRKLIVEEGDVDG